MASTVTVTLNARDEASSVVDKLAANISGNLASSFGKATLSANLMTEGIKAGLGAISGLVGKLQEGLTKAIDTQVENITVAGNIMKLTGQSYEEASGFIEDFSIKMSAVAASLPGATSDYVDFGKAIADDVIPALDKVNGKIDTKQFQKELQEVTTYGTLLAQSAKVSSTAAAMSVGKFLGGTASMAELQRLDFFEKNTTFRNSLKDELQKTKKDIKELTVKERFEVFKKAAAIPQEILEAQSKSVSGLLEGFRSSLFDPQSGLFGFMRDLDQRTKGNQSVLSAINEGLDLVVGPDGLFNSIGTTLKLLGVEFQDPMSLLREGILFFNSKIKVINDVLRAFTGGDVESLSGASYKMAANLPNPNKGNTDKLFKDAGGFFNGILNFKGIGAKLADWINTALDFLKNLNWSAVFSIVGQKLAEVFNEISRFLLRLDFNRILDTVLSVAGGLFVGLGKFLSTLDWGATMLALGKLLGVIILGTIALAGAMLVAPIVAGIGTLGAALAAAIVGLVAVIAANWEGVKSAAVGFVSGVLSKWSELTETVNGIWNGVVSAVTGLFAGIQSKFNELLSKIPFVSGSTAQTATPSGIGNAVTATVPNAATGLNGGSLMDAVSRERRSSPSGAGIVVANDTETILNRSQASRLLSSLSNRGQGINIGSLNISSNASDPKQVAKEVTDEIMRQFGLFNQGYVNAPV